MSSKPCLHCALHTYITEWFRLNPDYDRTEALSDVVTFSGQAIPMLADPEDFTDILASAQKHFSDTAQRAWRERLN